MPRKPVNRSICKKKNNITKKRSVKKMLNMMNPTNSEQPSSSSAETTNNHKIDDFLSTGRTGRRNALPDILSEHSFVTSAELPSELEALTTNDDIRDQDKPSTSKQADNVR